MKKLTILFAAVVLMAMTACNERVADNKSASDDAKAPAKTEQQAPEAKGSENQVKVNVQRIEPTKDGKEAVMAQFTDAKGAKVTLANKGDGSVSLKIWLKGQDGNPTYSADTKECVAGEDNYMLKSNDGSVYVITTKKGNETVTVMKDNQIAYATQQ